MPLQTGGERENQSRGAGLTRDSRDTIKGNVFALNDIPLEQWGILFALLVIVSEAGQGQERGLINSSARAGMAY